MTTPERLADTTALGLDEVAFLRANAHRHTLLATNFVDLVRGRLLDVVAGRSGRAVHDWLGTRPADWLAGVGTVAIDPFRGYANGVATHLGHATLRRRPLPRRGPGQPGHRRRSSSGPTEHPRPPRSPGRSPLRYPPPAAARHRAPHERSRARLEVGLAAGDPLDEVFDTVLAKEALRWSYAADIAEAARRFDAFIRECKALKVPELHRLARTAQRWRAEILAHHLTGASNGPTEASISSSRRSCALPTASATSRISGSGSFSTVAWEWHTPPAARIRGRSPRLVA